MTVSMNRVLAAVYPPENTPAFIILADAIVGNMVGNPHFPQPVPPLAEVRQAIAVLQEAEVVAQSKLLGAAAARDAARRALWSLLSRLKAYVQGVADDNAENAVAIIESSGMSVQPKGARVKPPFSVSPGRNRGTAILVVKAVAKDATYHWQKSEDGGLTWIDLPPTLQAKTTVPNLVPGKEYLFRYRTLAHAGLSDWSDPISFIVP